MLYPYSITKRTVRGVKMYEISNLRTGQHVLRRTMREIRPIADEWAVRPETRIEP